MGKIVHNAHDKLIKATLHNIDKAKSFLACHLSDKAKKYVDLEQDIELVNKEFIKEEYKELRCDILYKCNIKNKKGYIYTLIEGQSTAEELLSVRILAYNLELILWHWNNIKKEIPPIINLIIYNGEKSPYPYKINFLNLLNDYKISKELLFEGTTLLDLTIHNDNEIEKHGKTSFMELLLKHCKDRDFFNFLDNLKKSGKFKVLISGEDERYKYGILLFISDMLDLNNHTKEEIIDLIMGISPELDKEAMTFRESLIQQGIQQGMEQGMQQGIQREKFVVAENLFKMNLDFRSIRKATGLSKKELEELSKKI